MNFKHNVYNHYLNLVNDKVAMLQKVLTDLKESGTNETKSTAGDKHETALAMLQIEQANIRGQLQDALTKKSVFEKINPGVNAIMIVSGSLVKTNHGYLFLSVALGKASIDGVEVIALSPASPLGQKLMRLKVGDSVDLNGKTYIIEHIE